MRLEVAIGWIKRALRGMIVRVRSYRRKWQEAGLLTEDEELRCLLRLLWRRLFSPRAVTVSFLYLLSCVVLGVVLWKAVVIAAVMYANLILPLGRRAVETVGVLLVIFAMVKWADIEINEFAASATQGLWDFARR